MRRLLLSLVATSLSAVAFLVAPAQAATVIERAQARLNALHCDAGPVDGRLGEWTRSGIIRFQSRHRLAQSGRLDRATTLRLYADRARRCDRRPVPSASGRGRRIVISQRQNWVWLVRADGSVVRQGGIVDHPGVLARGSYRHGSYCGRAARIRRNSSSGGTLRLDNFVRFAPCGIGFHRIPTYPGSGAQIHRDHLLGTNLRASHGCIRVSRAMSLKIWGFARIGTPVRVV